MKTTCMIIATVAGGMMLQSALATPQLYVSQDGENDPFLSWTEEETVSGVSIDTGTGGDGVAVDGHAAALRIDADIGVASPDIHVIQTTDSNLIGNGNMTSYGANGTEIVGMRFDFYSGGTASGSTLPSSMGAYFVSDTQGVWAYDLTANLSDGWGTYTVGFGSSSGWANFTDTSFSAPGSGTFSTALTDVSALGIFAQYQDNANGQVYGLDNYGLTVPEPETYMMLGMAFLSVAVVFRKRITDSLAEARAMLQV